MPKYEYKVRDKFGQSVSDDLIAESETSAIGQLRKSNYTIVSLEEKKKESSLKFFLSKIKGVKLSELNMFVRQLATLQRAGVSIIRSIKALEDQAVNKILRDALEEIRKDIREGNSLSSALEKKENIFGHMYSVMIKVGEESGTLSDTLDRLATLGEHEQRVRMQVKAATRYPLMVVTAIIIAFLVLIFLVIPRFAKIYGSAGIELPLPTMILIWTHYAMTKFWWIIALCLGIFGFIFNRLLKTLGGRKSWDGFKLKIPVFGPLMVKVAMSKFSRVTGILMNSGVPILKILDLTKSSVDNLAIANALENIAQGVTEGRGISEPMKEISFFPPVVVQMVEIGEETGRLDELLIYVADYYDFQVEYTVSNMTSLLEPILLFILACGVLLMALGIFLPMWSLIDVFKGGLG